MIRLNKVLDAWQTNDFEEVFKKSIADLDCETLPLQKALTAGSFALEDSTDTVILKTAEHSDCLEIKAQLFFKSLTPGCACPGDPTVENDQIEQCTVLVSIRKVDAAATVTLLDE